MSRLYIVLLLALSLPQAATAQLSRAYLDYIEKYSGWAVEQMHAYKIPASITLAQGLLESRAGQSTLAVKANNHFGIKVGSNWTGPYVLKDDDAPNEKFRKYASARDSYIDHSIFLAQGQRYAPLFTLATTDYKGWAHGLKACGYATSPTYAQSLIRIIEIYELDAYDKAKGSKHKQTGMEVTNKAHTVFKNNRNRYIIVEAGDTFKSLARETGVSAYCLRKYNELPKGYQLQEGDILYLNRKRSKGEKKYAGYRHVISPGESMYTIAQQYGIRLKSLYRLNGKTPDYAAQPGDNIWVR